MNTAVVLIGFALLQALDTPATKAPAGATAEKDTWSVTLQVPPHARQGEKKQATVRIRSKAGYHVNGEYPTSFQPDPAATGALGSNKVFLTERLTASPCPKEAGQSCEIAFALPFTSPASGDAVLAGTLSFSVCSADRCLIEKVRLSAPAPAS